MIDAQVEDGSIAELQQHLLSAKRQEKYKYLLAGLSSGEETDSTKKKYVSFHLFSFFLSFVY